MHRPHRTLVPLGLVALVACSDAPTGPAGLALSERITLEQLGQALTTAPARLEVKLYTGTLVAREVELKTADEMGHRESVRSGVTGVAVSGDAGTVTLALGGLVIDFTGATRLRGPDGDDVTATDFAGWIDAALAAGMVPFVKARRPAPAEPQAPDVATFVATEIRIEDGSRAPKLELNVDADNFATNDTPPPDGFLRVLGLTIELRTASGETEIESDLDDRDEGEVEGIVQSVNVGAGTVTLVDGSIIRIITGETRFEADDDDDDEHLGSLAAVQQALDAGLTVEAEAEGPVEATAPLTIVAREVEFEVDDDADEPGEDGEFEAPVQSVSVGTRQVELADGRVIQLTDDTIIEADGDLLTLQAVADALAATQPVRAEGHAVLDAVGPPALLTAITIKFEVDD